MFVDELVSTWLYSIARIPSTPLHLKDRDIFAFYTGYSNHCWNNVIWSMLFILRLKWEINVDINDANKQKLVRSSIFIINLFIFSCFSFFSNFIIANHAACEFDYFIVFFFPCCYCLHFSFLLMPDHIVLFIEVIQPLN